MKYQKRDVPPFFRQALWLVLVLIAIPSLTFAQATSTIQGQVTDPSGAAVARAMVKATNEGTGFSRSAVTAADGYYRIPDLLPGSYVIRAESRGFKTFVRTNLEVTAESVLGLNIALELGAITQSVNVTAEGPQVETQVTRISEALPEREVRALPLQGRGVLNLAILTPGIIGKSTPPSNYCCDEFSNFGAPAISSGPNQNTSQYYLDGITLQYSEGSGWGAAFSPNPDAVEEVRVTTEPHSAELGRTSGPQVEVVTKGGTNNWHGTAHYTFQKNDLNARPFFSETSPHSYYRLFGGTGGGPIIKDRLFVFGAYEGLRSLVAGGYQALVETKDFVNWVVQTRPNSIAAKVFQAVPPLRYPTQALATTPDGIPEYGEISVDSPFKRSGNQFNGRVDYQFPNGKDRIFGSYWYTKPTWGSNPLRPAQLVHTSTTTQMLNMVHTHNFTANALNEARFGVWQIFFDQRYPNMPLNIPYLYSDDGVIGVNASYNNIYRPKVWHFSDVYHYNRGLHAIKFGVDYRRSLTTAEWPFPPTYLFSSILDFANDNPYLENQTIDPATGRNAGRAHLPFYVNDFALFVQNTWQIRPNLTLDYGLRWETFSPISLKDTTLSEPALTSAQAISPAAIAAVASQRRNPLYDRDLRDFGPRIGLAWDPTRQGKMSVRLNFGMLYDEPDTFPLYSVSSNPPTLAYLSAGPQLGVPILYALAPDGTQDFPLDPNLQAPKLDARGGIPGPASICRVS